jgi:hypothetical protein
MDGALHCRLRKVIFSRVGSSLKKKYMQRETPQKSFMPSQITLPKTANPHEFGL